MTKREIKFRAWDKKHHRMFDPGTFTIESDGGKILGFDRSLDGQHSEDDNDFEVLQFTGLKDKNGKDVYEGDILQGHSRKYSVAFDVRQAKFVLRFIYSEQEIENCRDSLSIPQTQMDIPVDALFHAVIGNIYENPELLSA